jgi:hypothetical protein
MPRKFLVVGGSLNQTTMMYGVARHLWDDHDFWLTLFFADGGSRWAS